MDESKQFVPFIQDLQFFVNKTSCCMYSSHMSKFKVIEWYKENVWEYEIQQIFRVSLDFKDINDDKSNINKICNKTNN